jgi:hypothetical protein
MKKSVSSSKPAVSKSSQKKRTPSDGEGNIGSQVTSNVHPEVETSEIPFSSWPIWNEQEVASEKWITKHAFEDPDGMITLPRKLRSKVDSWKRPIELITDNQSPVIVASGNLIDDYFDLPLNSVPSTPRSSNVSLHDSTPDKDKKKDIDNEKKKDDNKLLAQDLKDDKSCINDLPITDSSENDFEDENSNKKYSDASKLFQENSHLLGSELMCNIISAFHYMYSQWKKQKNPQNPDDFSLWDHIYPKGKDGVPVYNSSGKYVVKLYWLGNWRKITVDDSIPVDSKGRPLLIRSALQHELWPLILSKAILKIAELSYRESDEYLDFGDFDVIHTLSSWIVERYSFRKNSYDVIWNDINFITASNLTINCQSMNALDSVNQNANNNFNNSNNNNSNNGNSINNNYNNNISNNQINNSINNNGNQNQSQFGKSLNVDKDKMIHSSSKDTIQSPSTNINYAIFAWKEPGPFQCQISNIVNGVKSTIKQSNLYNLSFPYRVVEIKENFDNPEFERQIRLRGYFSSGYQSYNQKVLPKKNNSTAKSNKVIVEEQPVEHLPNQNETFDVWISFEEFCLTFKYILYYYSPSVFKIQNSFQYYPDSVINKLPVKDQSASLESLRIPQVLYVPNDTENPINVYMTVSTFSKVKPGISKDGSVIVQKYDWTSLKSPKPIIRLSTNASLTCQYLIKPGDAFSFIVDSPCGFISVQFWTFTQQFLLEDEGKYLSDVLKVNVIDVDDSFNFQQPNSWNILFKQAFTIPKPVLLYPTIYVPESIQYNTSLHVIDNDTNKEIDHSFFRVKPKKYLPNTNGYTVVAECKSPNTKINGRWKMRLISYPVSIPEPLTISKYNVQDFNEIYTPNKHNVLFRYLVKVKDCTKNQLSLKLTFSNKNSYVTLNVYDRNELLVSSKGKGTASIMSVYLEREHIEKIQDKSAKELTKLKEKEKEREKEKEKETKKDKDKEKEKDKDKDKDLKKVVTEDQKEGNIEVEKELAHRYIIEGIVEILNLQSTSSNPLNTTITEENRVNSDKDLKNLKNTSGRRKRNNSNVAAITAMVALQKKVESKDKDPAKDISVKQDKSNSNIVPSVSGNSNAELSYKLRLISSGGASLIVTKDMEKEEKYKIIKDSWEAAEVGRALKAKESRINYLKQLENGTVKTVPLFTKNFITLHGPSLVMNRYIDNYLNRSTTTATTSNTSESDNVIHSASNECKTYMANSFKTSFNNSQENENSENLFEKSINELLDQTNTQMDHPESKHLLKKYFSESNLYDIHNYSKNFNKMNSQQNIIKGSKDIIEKIMFSKPVRSYEQLLNDNNIMMTEEEISLLRTKSTTLSYNDYLTKHIYKIDKIPKPPLLYKPWSIVYELDQPPRLKDEELINHRIKRLEEINQKFNDFQSLVANQREENRRMRNQEKQIQIDRIIDKRSVTEQLYKIDLERRKIYKNNLLEELKQLKIQIEQEKELQDNIKSIQNSQSFIADTDF